jgi:endogenous inhibitor of DNA gyrase (YacG/DUF329 family)
MFSGFRQLIGLISELLTLAKTTEAKLSEEASLRPRQLQNLTNTYAELIRRDFPEFDPQEFLSTAEGILLFILSALENQNHDTHPQVTPQLLMQVRETLKDIQSKNERWYFDDITIHKSAIAKYQKKNGSLEIHVECAISYRYRVEKDEPIGIESQETPLHQYKYNLTAVYVQNVDQLGQGSMKGHNCPNCGAPVTSLGENKKCTYCGTGLTEINSRIWLFDHYKRS